MLLLRTDQKILWQWLSTSSCCVVKIFFEEFQFSFFFYLFSLLNGRNNIEEQNTLLYPTFEVDKISFLTTTTFSSLFLLNNYSISKTYYFDRRYFFCKLSILIWSQNCAKLFTNHHGSSCITDYTAV